MSNTKTKTCEKYKKIGFCFLSTMEKLNQAFSPDKNQPFSPNKNRIKTNSRERRDILCVVAWWWVEAVLLR